MNKESALTYLSLCLVGCLSFGLWGCVAAQGASEEAEKPRSKARDALRFDYVRYRPTAALAVEPDGVRELPFEIKDDRIKLNLGDLNVCRLIVLSNDANAERAYKEAFGRILEDEKREV